MKFSENLVKFLLFILKNSNASNSVDAFHKKYSHTLFATNAQVDVSSILYSVSMATLYCSVNS